MYFKCIFFFLNCIYHTLICILRDKKFGPTNQTIILQSPYCSHTTTYPYSRLWVYYRADQPSQPKESFYPAVQRNEAHFVANLFCPSSFLNLMQNLFTVFILWLLSVQKNTAEDVRIVIMLLQLGANKVIDRVAGLICVGIISVPNKLTLMNMTFTAPSVHT